jgi:hypothetical protein
MNTKAIIFLLLCLFSIDTVTSQTLDRTGNGYFYWGYNRAFYSASDITFTGEGYDFSVDRVLAFDKPTPYNSSIYFNPAKLTIPQFNFRLGYYINSKTSLSFGWEHMKYVVDDFQVVNINGTIEGSASPSFAANYNEESITLHPSNFLHFEHTDGLNYVRFNIDHHHELKSLWKDRIQLSYVLGAGTGLMMPQTDITLFGERTNNNTKTYIQGFALSSNYGLKIDLFKHFYIQMIAHNGYINMPAIRTRGDNADRASQEIWFMEYIGVFGAYFPIKKKEALK